MAAVATVKPMAQVVKSCGTLGARGRAASRPTAVGISVRRVVASAAAEDRQMWLNGFTPPKHLDGSMAGDYGFDILGLGTDPEKLKYYREAELSNGRWCMMAVAGIMFTEATGVCSKWWEAGALDYGFDKKALLAIEFAVLGFFEIKRINGYIETGQSGMLDMYPFDPLNFGKKDATMKLREIKNARLAMISFVGFCVQALVVRKGPLACFVLHISDPWKHNLFTEILNIPENISN